jgi:5-methylcytosine-specific restriction endonuclease McrA
VTKAKPEPKEARPPHTRDDRFWWDLKAQVLARPHGGQGHFRKDGTFRLERHGRCERCGKQDAVDAHHRVPVSAGGPDAASNLAALCRECHDWVHQHPSEARLGGWIVRRSEDIAVRAILPWDGSVVLLDDEANYSFQKWPA